VYTGSTGGATVMTIPAKEADGIASASTISNKR
jgi:hypothetical protein